MDNTSPYRFVIAFYVPLIVIFMVGRSDGRELRPSEHGLAYQNTNGTAVGGKSPEMQSFFGGARTSASASVPLPEAKNMSDADMSWWRDVSGGGGGGRRRDHARDVLVVASVVCGATGVVLLVVAALLFLFQYQRQRSNGRSK